ncbi:hypothetical protein [Nocardioides speluncae]|uniref:hypothetical protein n=1 Tax=Nocardioides speluncae TaxID=2670337 RepID=UPI000D68682F|nr:hypothetical protein [Nocardioides speluncae]
MKRDLRGVAGLPAVALVLVAGVLGVQVAAGGGSFEPLKPADACAERVVTTQSEGIEGLTERLVLIGINEAACTLGLSREALTLELAQPGERTDEEIDALREGLKSAVRQLEEDGELPPPSELVNEALDTSDMNGFQKAAIRAIPDAMIDASLDTDDILLRAIDDLDLRDLLANLDNEDDLNKQIQDAVTQAVKDSLLDRLSDLL